jgi:hypothetical protein
MRSPCFSSGVGCTTMDYPPRKEHGTEYRALLSLLETEEGAHRYGQTPEQ